MRILLTGCTGQVGRELYSLLTPLGEVIAPDRSMFDLSDPESLSRKICGWKPDLIVNPAAYTAVDQAETDSEIAFTVNADAPKVIAQEANQLGVPLIHYSTDYVFDGKKELPYLESDQPAPLNIYGESKLQGELNVIQYHDKHVILRTSWVYSAYGNNFLKTMLRLFSEKKEISVVSDQYGVPTSAKMLAGVTVEVINKVLDCDDNWGIYHASAKGKASWYEFAQEIFIRVKDKKEINDVEINRILTEEYGFIAKRPESSVLNSDKLDRCFGVNREDWKNYLSRCL